MYFLCMDGKYQTKENLNPEEVTERYIAVHSYDELSVIANRFGLPVFSLEEARRFGYAKIDVYEEYACISLEILDFRNILVHRGNAVLYLDGKRAFFFTSEEKLVSQILIDTAEFLGEKVSLNRMIYLFFEAQIKEDDDIFDSIEKETMELEQALITSQKRNCVSEIIHLRKRIMVLKRYYEQLLNTLDIIEENENEIFDRKTLQSFKLFSRRVERRYQGVLNLRDSVTQVRESYEAEVDINLNTTMKLFTVVTTIFLPLTLVAGWYGMNFKMPEYDWEHGYWFVIGISVAFIAVGIYIFKKKKWF